MLRPADRTDKISRLGARQILDHALAGPLPLLQEDQEIGHLLSVGPLVELPDDVGAYLARRGEDPKEIPTRRWSKRVSDASRILPKHRGASVSAPGARASYDGDAGYAGDASGTHMAERGSTLSEIGDIIMGRAALCRTLTDACWCAQRTFRHTF